MRSSTRAVYGNSKDELDPLLGSAGFADEPELEPLCGNAGFESLEPLLGSAGLNEPEVLPLRETEGKSPSELDGRRARATRSESCEIAELELALRGSGGVNGVPAESVAATRCAELLGALGEFGEGAAFVTFIADALGAAALSGGATFDGAVVGGASLGLGAGTSRGARACCS